MPNLFTKGHKPFIQKGSKNGRWKGGVSKNEYLSYHREYQRKYNELYPDKVYNCRKKHKMMRRNAKGFHTLKEWKELKKKWNFMCLCCKQFEPEIKLTEDHIVPISKGGTDFIDNIQPLCMKCNQKKSVKTISFNLSKL